MGSVILGAAASSRSVDDLRGDKRHLLAVLDGALVGRRRRHGDPAYRSRQEASPLGGPTLRANLRPGETRMCRPVMVAVRAVRPMGRNTQTEQE